VIRHCVLCRFRKDVDETELADIEQRLFALCESLPNVLDASFGPNASPESLDAGFAHGFVIDFVDEAARDAYLIDDDHQAFGADLVGRLDGGTAGLVVFDLVI